MISSFDLQSCPVIAAVKDEGQLERALKTDCELIFLLFGDILNISRLVETVHGANKCAIAHIDLINGLSSREIAVDFLHKTANCDGIISTRPPLIRRAKELKMYTVLRMFIIDSMALSNISFNLGACNPDVVEILPGIMPDIIRKVHNLSKIPVIAGGLISSKNEVLSALKAGAAAVSTTNEEVWSV